MKLHIWSHENLKSIVSIGNYSPRRCGIATFTSDLLGAIQEEATDTNCWAIAMNDTPEGYHYPERVRFEINQHQLSDYKLAAEFLNMNKIDIVNLQHEYGIFGGIAGSNIIRLISDLRMPVVTTLHTVLKKPTPEQKEALGKVIKLSSRIVVMSKKAISILKELYSIPEEKIVFIPHGIPDSPYIDPNYYKDQFGVEGKNVILTFGFISQNKGLEYAIKALPEIIKKHKDVVYIILGATHPHVLKTQGEEYRISLQQLAEKLGVSEHVIFQNRFVELNELCEFLGIADIYITPYINEDQIVSGTLAYAIRYPDRHVYIYFLFPVKVKYLVGFLALVSFMSTWNAQGDGIAHAAHLGGMVVGWVYLKYWHQCYKLKAMFQQQPKKHTGAKTSPGKGNEKVDYYRKKIDELLDKINRVGYLNLTVEEEELLEEGSKYLREHDDGDYH